MALNLPQSPARVKVFVSVNGLPKVLHFRGEAPKKWGMIHPAALFSRQCKLIALVFWGALLGCCYALTYKFHTDITQMLDRGIIFALENKIIFFGNASSAGMGKVPGGVSSLLVGLPLKLWLSPYSILLSIVLLHLLSFGLLWQVFREFFSQKALWIFLLLFWLSPWRISEIYIWNPAYLFVASAIHFYTAFKMSEKASFWPSFFHVFSIWFAFQIHNSSILLFFISSLLFYRKKIKLHWWGILTSGVLGVITLVPYGLALMESPELSPEIRDDRFFLFRGLLYVFPMLKAIWYWVRFSSTVFPKPILQHMDLAWLGIGVLAKGFGALWLGLQYGTAVVTALGSFRANYRYWKRPKNRWIDAYVGASFVALLLGAAISPIDFMFWHLIILFPMALVPVVDFFDRDVSARRARMIFVAGAVYFSVYNGLAGLGSEKHSFSENPQVEFLKRLGE